MFADFSILPNSWIAALGASVGVIIKENRP